MKTLEGKRAINDFMGRRTGFGTVASWDWNELMPVIEKISKLKFKYLNVEEEFSPYPRTFGMVSEEGLFMFCFNCGQLFSAETLIEAAWSAVVDFLEQYKDEIKATEC